MKIGEIAQKTGLTTRTIRYYEELNILKPKYSKNGIRFFSEIDILKLNLISFLKELDFPLCKIQSILSCDKNIEFIKNSLEKEINNLSNVLAELERIKIENERAMKMLETCKNCDKKPTHNTCSVCPNISENEKENIIIKSLN